MKNLSIVLMLLCIASISQAVMLADFETGVDNFIAGANTTVSQSQTPGTVTSGEYSLKIQQTEVTYWGVRWQAPSVPTRLGKLQFDLTMIASEWPSQPWTRFAQKIAIQSRGDWTEYETNESNWVFRETGLPAPVDWGAWDGDVKKTCTIDISNYSLTGSTYFTINFSTGISGTKPYGGFYIDNVHFVDEPWNPNPANGGLGGLSTNLSWNNATDSLNWVKVWFAETPVESPTDPNTKLTLDTYKNLLTNVYTEINPGATSTCPNANIGTLTDGKEYTWCVESDPNTIPVLFWTFTATPNVAPTADAGADQDLWLGGNPSIVATLDGSNSSDDGLIAPLTYTWTQTAGPEVTIDSPNSAITTVTLSQLANSVETWNNPAAAAYVFQLTVNDGQAQDTDSVTVTLSTDSCIASVEAGGYFFYGDIAGPNGVGPANRDCQIDLYDLAEIAINWLGCSNTFESCN
jgi:hypothetical protein